MNQYKRNQHGSVNYLGMVLLGVAFAVLAVPSLSAQTFYSDLSEDARIELALSYLMVSRQYAEVGKEEKAAAHEKMALTIYPQVKEIEKPSREDGAEESGSGEAGDPGTAAAVQPQERPRPDYAIKYTFNSFLRAFFQEDTEKLSSLLTNPDQTVAEFYSCTEVESLGFQKTFAEEDFTAVPFSQIFDSSSIRIRETAEKDSAGAAAGGYGVWALDIDVNPSAPGVMEEKMPCWGENQTYFFVQRDGRWQISRAEFREASN